MADISDVTALLTQMATAAVYPNGASSPSVTTKPITIFEGWPLQQSLDAAIAAGQSQVSIFPTRASAGAVFQVQNEDYLIVPPVHGLTITSISGGIVSVTGAPTAGEYLTIIADGRHAYSRVGPDLPNILSQLAADATADYPSVTVVPGGIQFPTDRLKAHVGAPAIKGRVTHRQRASVIISVWAPNNADRNAIAIAIDVALKAVNRLTFPDTSQGVIKAERFEQIDRLEPASIYRRDLVFSIEYATLEEYEAFEVTSFTITEDAGAESTYVIG